MTAAIVVDRSTMAWFRGNAPTESFVDSFEKERVHGAPYTTREVAVADLFDDVARRSVKHGIRLQRQSVN